jgi:hypothetical protein
VQKSQISVWQPVALYSLKCVESSPKNGWLSRKTAISVNSDTEAGSKGRKLLAAIAGKRIQISTGMRVEEDREGDGTFRSQSLPAFV